MLILSAGPAVKERDEKERPGKAELLRSGCRGMETDIGAGGERKRGKEAGEILESVWEVGKEVGSWRRLGEEWELGKEIKEVVCKEVGKWMKKVGQGRKRFEGGCREDGEG